VRALGQDLSDKQPLAINRIVHVVAGRAERDDAVRRYAERFLTFYDRWGHEDVRQLGSADRAVAETARQHFIIGEAAECVEQIQRYAELGIGHMACLMNFGRPPLAEVDASLRRFGAQVLPRFR
jgi:alkanesulfonate monooxygenase SsuD/methylene tetrahydromethanopterin reductase-like flavin-dependent oxidoreductase (luciferase family)